MKDWVCDRFSKDEPDQSDLSYLSPINTTAGVVVRLVDLKVPEFLVRDVLRGVLGQELLVTPCPVCGGTGVGERRLAAESWEGVSRAWTLFLLFYFRWI